MCMRVIRSPEAYTTLIIMRDLTLTEMYVQRDGYLFSPQNILKQTILEYTS